MSKLTRITITLAAILRDRDQAAREQGRREGWDEAVEELRGACKPPLELAPGFWANWLAGWKKGEADGRSRCGDESDYAAEESRNLEAECGR
jgi:hypothetical protein